MLVELNAEQKRIATLKPKGHQLVKGEFGAGKTAVGLYRGHFLLNNYCFAKDDAVLLTARSTAQVEYMVHAYGEIQGCPGETLPLFVDNDDRLEIRTVDDVMGEYSDAYQARKKLTLSLPPSRQLSLAAIDEGRTVMQERFAGLNVLNQKNVGLLLQEILWIKNCLYHGGEDAYQSAARKGMAKIGSKGALQRLRKHSKTRRAIWELMDCYGKKMRKQGLIDAGDLRIMALEQARVTPVKRYTHIIVDEAQDLTRSQLLFLKAIYNEKDYACMGFIFDTTRTLSPESWLGPGRSFAGIGFPMQGRSHTLTKNTEGVSRRGTGGEYRHPASGAEASAPVQYHYRNFKTGQASFFSFDPDAPTAIDVDHQGESERIKEKQLSKVPVYGRIQAGVPMHMNAEFGEELYLPEAWIRGADHFALMVRGDSMTGVDINDGDIVVIRKQNTADNLDIVAVALGDEATLKRFRKTGKTAVLTAENPDYDPISLNDEQVAILGRAVGLIKK